MAARARHSNSTYGASDGEERYEHDEFWPGERIGPARSGTRGKTVLKAIVVILTMLGGGWLWFGDPAACPACQSIAAAVSSLMTGDTPQRIASTTAPARLAPIPPPAQAAAPDPLPSIVESSVPSKTATPPSPTEGPQAPPQTTAALAPAAAGPGATAASPAALPADAADPYQARAAAAGLHPDLSRVLLARLSPADYRNAGIAVQTAVAETPDSGVFAWPRQRKPELAFFQVRFVAGAAPGCRRYVVTITKDGWLTTAPPMERCGPQPGQPRRE